MSFLKRLFGGGATARDSAEQPGRLSSFETTALLLHGPPADDRPFPLEVVGESHYQDALWRSVGSRDPVEGRRHQTRAVLLHQPSNKYDSNAIAVFTETPRGFEQVGYLSRDDAADYVDDFLELAERGYRSGACEAVILGGAPDRVRGTTHLGIWLHLDEPGAIVPDEDEKPRGYLERPPREGQVRTGGSSDLRSEAGLVRGKHYTDWVDDITALKRHKAHEECCALLGELLDAVEREATEQSVSPAPWYYQQMAIVLRKEKDFDGEIAVIERYLAFPHPTWPPRPELQERLAKAIAKRERAPTG